MPVGTSLCEFKKATEPEGRPAARSSVWQAHRVGRMSWNSAALRVFEGSQIPPCKHWGSTHVQEWSITWFIVPLSETWSHGYTACSECSRSLQLSLPRFVLLLTSVGDLLSSEAERSVYGVMMMFLRTSEEWAPFVPGLYGQSTGQE